MAQPLIDPEDVLLCLGAGRDVRDHHGAVLPSIVQASLFRQPDMATLFDGLARESAMPVYSRGTNPTVAALEEVLARLERGEACRCFASGMGAIAAALAALTKSGDHVLFVGTIYGPTLEFAARMEDYGVSWSRSEASDLAGIEADIKATTRLIYMESPGSMLFGLLPIAEIAASARARGIVTILDNSVATPLLQKPLELGVDLVVHSLSKYVGGHSDLLAGALIGDRDRVETVFRKGYMLMGAVMAPFTAWLLLRSLMTLPVRLAKQSTDALALARRLADDPRIARVHHPALPSGGLFGIQSRGHSGLFAFEVGTFSEAVAVADRLRLFGRAVSWGGPESLVMTGHKADPGLVAGSGLPAGLLRLSIGLEGVEALWDDLDCALG